jgi:hypothetical protein
MLLSASDEMTADTDGDDDCGDASSIECFDWRRLLPAAVLWTDEGLKIFGCTHCP